MSHKVCTGICVVWFVVTNYWSGLTWPGCWCCWVLLVVRELRPFKRQNTYYVWDGDGDDEKLAFYDS
jgi:hypothetical protein